jgi:hypothetical protein
MLPKEPSLAACTGLNHMGALNSCTLMDLSPGASTSLPASGDKQTRKYASIRAKQNVSNGEKGRRWEVPLAVPLPIKS